MPCFWLYSTGKVHTNIDVAFIVKNRGLYVQAYIHLCSEWCMHMLFPQAVMPRHPGSHGVLNKCKTRPRLYAEGGAGRNQAHTDQLLGLNQALCLSSQLSYHTISCSRTKSPLAEFFCFLPLILWGIFLPSILWSLFWLCQSSFLQQYN